MKWQHLSDKRSVVHLWNWRHKLCSSVYLLTLEWLRSVTSQQSEQVECGRMVTPNRKLSCLFVLITSSLLVPCVVYLVYIGEVIDFSHYRPGEQRTSDANEVLDEFLVTQSARRAEVRRHCAQYELDQVGVDELPIKTLSSIIVDDTHHTLYCQVPKIACTNWRRVFLVLSGHVNTSNPLDILSDDAHHKYKNRLRYLHQYSRQERRHRLKHYLKFMFSREPLERILSAYRNKLVMKFNPKFLKQYGRKIIQRYRPNASAKAREEGADVTFPEFVSYLLDPRTVKSVPLNEHWIQQYKLCFPCTVDYNFIGRYENLASDADNILNHIDPNATVGFPARDATYSHSKTSDTSQKYFRKIPNETLSELYQMYYLDYAIFGYPYPEFLRNL